MENAPKRKMLHFASTILVFPLVVDNRDTLYIKQLNSREESFQKYFDNDFTNVDLRGNVERDNFVDSFDNFLQPKPNEAPETASNAKPKAFLYDKTGFPKTSF